jgi:AraC-like DNA-binding protein
MLSPPRGPVGFHIMATGAGFERRANEVYSWEGLKRGDEPWVVIQHTIAGRGELDYAGTRHGLLPGSTMVLTFPHANRYWLERGQSWEHFWIGVNGREALRLARAIIDLRGPVLLPPPGAVDRMAAACLALIAGSDPPSGEISARAYEALTALHDGLFGAEPSSGADLPPAIAMVKSFIDAHLSEPLGVDRLARMAGLSRWYFVRHFTATTGSPPSVYVFGRRIERAARLLAATDAPVETVSAASGFADANYFAKAFRRAYGVTPSAYRETGATLLPRRRE